jgi:hypothetical protein
LRGVVDALAIRPFEVIEHGPDLRPHLGIRVGQRLAQRWGDRGTDLDQSAHRLIALDERTLAQGVQEPLDLA